MPYAKMPPQYGQELGLDLLGLVGPMGPAIGEIEDALSIYMRKRQEIAQILKQKQLEKYVAEHGVWLDPQAVMKNFYNTMK